MILAFLLIPVFLLSIISIHVAIHLCRKTKLQTPDIQDLLRSVSLACCLLQAPPYVELKDNKDIEDIKAAFAAISFTLDSFVHDTFAQSAIGGSASSGDVAPGYYYVTSTAGTAVVLQTLTAVTINGLDLDEDYYLVGTKAPTGYNGLHDPIHLTVNGRASVHEDVTNNKGAELPSTGGIGTTLFYISGGILVLAAVILLVTKKRMSAND